MNWLRKLQTHWKVESLWQVMVILLVFACTGFTVMWISRPILILVFEPEEVPGWGKVIYYVAILPFYNLILLAFGYVFGQFKFFYEFEKRFLNRIFSKFRPR